MKIKLLSVFIFLCCMPVLAYNLDTSVDKDIQKKYNANKLNEDMKVSPPKTNNNTTEKTTKSVPKAKLNFNEDTEKPVVNTETSVYKQSGIRIPKWTSFKVKSNQKITNWLGVGNSVSFTTTAPVYKKHVTILSGTVFNGKIVKIHKPQMTGNGALVEVKIVSMIYNGKTYQVNGKITKANSELIFFNNIKGDRQYLCGVKNKIKSSTNFYKKSRNISNKLAQNPIGVIIAPFPTIVGFVGGTLGTVVSPVTGMLEKGKNISLPVGTSFEIKLLEDVYVK